MKENPAFRRKVLDVFERYDPLKAEKASVYEGVVNDLLRYWRERDSENEVYQYVQGVLYMHGKRCNNTIEELTKALLNLRC